MSLLAEFHSIVIPFWSYLSQIQCNHSSRIFYFVDFLALLARVLVHFLLNPLSI